MEFHDLKIAYAQLLFLDPGNPFECGKKIFPDNTGYACMAAVQWKNDPIVIEEMQRLAEQTPIENLVATKQEALQEAWNMAKDTSVNPKERAAYLRLFSELAEYMPEKSSVKNVQKNEVINRVMMVKDHGEDENWEDKAAEQQRKLINAN